MRAFRIALLVPLLLLIWLVTTASMCPNNGTTPDNDGRTADIQAFLEISPAVPHPHERVQFEVSELTTNGNPDAFAAWMIAIYSGEWTGPLPTQFQPGASNLVGTIEMESALEPGETRDIRYRFISEGTYTVVLYLSTSSLGGNRYRSAKRRLAVNGCEGLSVTGFKNTLTLGDGYDPAFRNLEDMGHILQVPGVDPGSIPEAVIGEPFTFDLKRLLSTLGEFAEFTLEAQDAETGLTVTEDGILAGTALAGTNGLHWMRVRIEDHCLNLGPLGHFLTGDGDLRDIVVRWPYRIVDTTCPSFDILPAVLPAAALNEPYAQTFSSSGGTPPITFELFAGTLPAGLSFTGTGLAGTPTDDGAFDFTIRGTDSCVEDDARVVDMDYTLIVIDPEDCPNLTAPGGSLEDGQVGVPYDDNLIFFDGLPPVTTTVIEGALPPGLTIDPSTVHLIGTPTTAGDFSFRIRVSDSCPDVQTIQITYDITIEPAPGCTTMTGQTSLMSAGTVGTPYSGSVSVSGGELPIEMEISSGSLPPGLTLNNVGGAGQVTGTPTTDGVFTFNVHVTDDCTPPQEVDMPLSITINTAAACAAPPQLQITGLPSGLVGTPYDVGISASNGEGTLTFSVIAGALPDGLSLLPEGEILGTPTLDGTFNFTLQVADSCDPVQTDSQAVSITIVPNGSGCQELNLNPLTVPEGVIGDFYETFFGEWVSGGEGTKTFFIQAPTLPPPGLSLNQDTGTLSGTPTTFGEFQFILQVIDECVPVQSEEVVVTVNII